MSPRISVLLPYRDAEATIEAALTSVLADRDVALEVIAVDDGSRDASASIASRIAARDPRVGLVRGEGRGIVRALELGRGLSRAPYLGRMDADDVSLEGRWAAQLSVLEREPSVAVVGTRVEAFVDEGTLGEGLARYVEWQNAILSPDEHEREIFVEAPLCHPSVLMRASAIAAVGGYRDTSWPEDYDLWLRLVARGMRLAKVERLGLRWRHREGRLTFTDPRYAPEQHRALKASYLAERLAREPRAIVVWGAGPTGRRLARALEPHGVRASAFVDIDPDKIGRRARGAPIVAASALARDASFVVVAVGARGARALIRESLGALGFVEGRDFVCAA